MFRNMKDGCTPAPFSHMPDNDDFKTRKLVSLNDMKAANIDSVQDAVLCDFDILVKELNQKAFWHGHDQSPVIFFLMFSGDRNVFHAFAWQFRPLREVYREGCGVGCLHWIVSKLFFFVSGQKMTFLPPELKVFIKDSGNEDKRRCCECLKTDKKNKKEDHFDCAGYCRFFRGFCYFYCKLAV